MVCAGVAEERAGKRTERKIAAVIESENRVRKFIKIRVPIFQEFQVSVDTSTLYTIYIIGAILTPERFAFPPHNLDLSFCAADPASRCALCSRTGNAGRLSASATFSSRQLAAFHLRCGCIGALDR